MKRSLLAGVLAVAATATQPAVAATATQPAVAAQLDVTIQNLTRGIYFTPILIGAHASGSALFTAGQPASTQIQAMAEGGDIAPLQAQLQTLGAASVANPAGGLLAPAQTTSTTIVGGADTANPLLSIVAMILPSPACPCHPRSIPCSVRTAPV
ncbi:MAG: spondin domain-containing protein [Burkholderiaceae bacterium]